VVEDATLNVARSEELCMCEYVYFLYSINYVYSFFKLHLFSTPYYGIHCCMCYILVSHIRSNLKT
jgi:hypothetical protein